MQADLPEAKSTRQKLKSGPQAHSYRGMHREAEGRAIPEAIPTILVEITVSHAELVVLTVQNTARQYARIPMYTAVHSWICRDVRLLITRTCLRSVACALLCVGCRLSDVLHAAKITHWEAAGAHT